MLRSVVAKERNDLIGYSINTLYNETPGLQDLDPLGNHKHPCTLHPGVYTGFHGALNPIDPSISSYNLYLHVYGGLTEDSAPIVGDLITSDCIVKLHVKSSVIPHLFRGNLITGSAPLLGQLMFQISTLLHYSPIWEEEGEGGA